MNYHHLRYFLEVCRAGGVTKAAARLRVAQSAVSIQVRALEDDLGVHLFDRTRKGLHLTEAGVMARDAAEQIFGVGTELKETLRRGAASREPVLHVGAVATLSRNFVLSWLDPCGRGRGFRFVIHAAPLRDLLLSLRNHALDVVLSNVGVPRDSESPWHSHLIDSQPVSIVARKGSKRLSFPGGLDGEPMVLPSIESGTRAAFDRMMEGAGVYPNVVAEIGDMALLRLFARETGLLSLVPRVVVRDELRVGTLVEKHRVRDLKEDFYAITPSRKYPHPALHALLARDREWPGASSGV